MKGIRCAVCSKAKPPEIAKPGRIKTNIGQFNDALLGDICYETDANGRTHGWLLVVDEGIGWTVAKYLSGGKTWQELCAHIEEGWIDWAGPPGIFVADSERGFIAEGLAIRLGKAGTVFTPSAGYAPWQRGQVERKVQSFQAIIRKIVLHHGMSGPADMKLAGV